ncbi:MAG: MATE family efflux transporter [Thermoplasmata archaeon]|nr:MATE family efflux transporter [Thermoplasmata archaeon]
MSSKDDLNRMLGEPKAAIRAMILPFLLAMAVVEMNQFIDTFWVSGLGARSASAVSTIIPVYGLMMCAGLGIAAGITTTGAFRLGRGEYDQAGRLAANALILGIVFAVAASVLVAIFLNPIIDIMGAQDVRDEAVEYMMPYILMSPAILLLSIVGGMLRAEGAAKKSTIIQIAAAVFNMVLDPILIYGLDLGVFGAGLATAVSSLLALIIGLYWYIRKRTVIGIDRSNFHADREAMSEVLGVGGPKTVQMFISNFTDFLQRIFLIIAGGTNAVMLYNYSWRYIGVVTLPGRAVDTAMLPVCSSAFGREDLEKMKTGFLYSAKLVAIFGTIFAVILFVFAEPLMSIMTYEESMNEILSDFVWTLRVSCFLIPFAALMGVGASMLQAMKKAKIPMYFYIVWGFIKIGLYAIAAYGYFGVDPFEGIIYCMVAVHIGGAFAMNAFALKEYRTIKRYVQNKDGTSQRIN